MFLYEYVLLTSGVECARIRAASEDEAHLQAQRMLPPGQPYGLLFRRVVD